MQQVWALTCKYLCMWFILHVIAYFIEKRNKTPPSAVSELERQNWLIIKPFNISWRTTLFNHHFIRLTNYKKKLWCLWFQLGMAIAILLMVIGSWIVIRSSFEIIEIIFSYNHLVRKWLRIEKRNFRLLQQQQHSTLLPMIPGLTLPLDHSIYYIISLLVGALFHEIGHALCAGIHGLTIRYFGLFFAYLYPGAFISISEQELAKLDRWKKLQIACGGIWHNLILYGVCQLLNWSSSKDFIWCHLGWKNLTREKVGGVSVVNIHYDSPLQAHLQPGARIFQLDDTPIVNGIADWEMFWNMDFTPSLKKGFCTEPSAQVSDLDCCEITSSSPFGNSSNPMISCFENIKGGKQACFNTLDILASINTIRCLADADCYEGYNNACVVPVTPSMYDQRVRIFAESDGKGYITSIYEGTLRDVLDSVQVSDLHPKYFYLPVQLPHKFNLLTSYIATFSFALALLNSVPAFSLDGVSILRQLLSTKKKLFTVITKLMTGLVLFVIFGSVFILLLQKM